MCINKYADDGVDSALFDDQRCGRPTEITDDAKAWMINIACQKPCDPDFDAKMRDVLVVYKQVSMQFDDDGNIIIPEDGIQTVTLSYDEKPGIHAIGNTCPNKNPTSGNGFVSRDSEYV